MSHQTVYLDQNAWDNGSWIRTEGDIQITNRFLEERSASLRQELEAREMERTERLNATWDAYHASKRERTLAGPKRALKQYQNAIRKIGLMAVSEALR